MNSMAQQAVPNGMGHSDPVRAQLARKSKAPPTTSDAASLTQSIGLSEKPSITGPAQVAMKVTIDVEVFAKRNPDDLVTVKVTEASLTYVAVGEDGRPRPLPPA